MSFVESATLKIIDQSTRPLANIQRSVTSLFNAVNRLNGRRIRLQVDTRSLDTLERRLGRLQTTARGIRIDTSGIQSAITQANQLAAAMQRAAQAARQIGQVRMPAGAVAGAAPYYGSASPAYPPRSMAERFHRNLQTVPPRYAAYETTRAGHAVVRQGGAGMLEGNTQRMLLEAQNIPAPVRKLIIDEAARAAGKFRLISDANMMEIGRTAYGNLKDPKSAGQVMDTMGRSAQLMALNYKSAEKGTEAARQFYRAADVAGVADDPEKLEKFIRGMSVRTLISGPDINAMQAATSIARGGGVRVFGGMNEQSIGDMITLVDEMKGQASQNVRTFYRELTAPNLAKENQGMMKRYGLRNSDGSTADQALLQRDPFEWTMARVKAKIIAPKSQGGLGIDYTSIADDAERGAVIGNAVGKMGFLDSGSRLAIAYLLKENEIRRARRQHAESSENYNDTYLSQIPYKELRSGMTATKSQYEMYIDHLTKPAQGWMSRRLGDFSGVLNTASQNPFSATGLGALAVGGVGALGYYAANNPQVIAGTMMLKAAAMQLAAAGIGNGKVLGALGSMFGFGKGAATGASAAAAAAGLAAMRGGGNAFSGGILGGVNPALAAAGAGVAGGGLLSRLMAGWSGSGWLGKGFGVLAGGMGLSQLYNGDLLGGGLTLAGTAGMFLAGPLGMALKIAGLLGIGKDLLFPGAANAAGLASTPAGVATAAGALPKPAQDRAKLLDQRAAEWSKKGVSVDWRKSVVDLMKLMGLDDNGFDSRKKLWEAYNKAERYRGTGDQNRRLYEQVSREVANDPAIAMPMATPAVPEAPKTWMEQAMKQIQDNLGRWREILAATDVGRAFLFIKEKLFPAAAPDAENGGPSTWESISEWVTTTVDGIIEKMREINRTDDLILQHQQRMENETRYGRRSNPRRGMSDWDLMTPADKGAAVLQGADQTDADMGKSMREALGMGASVLIEAGQQASATWYERLVSAGTALGAAAAAQISAARVDVNVQAPAAVTGRGSVGEPAIGNK